MVLIFANFDIKKRVIKTAKNFHNCFQPFFQIIREFGKEIQTGLFFHFVYADGEHLQRLIGGMVRNDEANHFYWWSQVINDFVKRFGNGDSAGWQIFGFRRRRKYRSGMAGEDKKVTKGSCFFYEVFVPAQQRQK